LDNFPTFTSGSIGTGWFKLNCAKEFEVMSNKIATAE
jgi:hypothetical protein